MFCAACIVVNVNVALHLDLCEKNCRGWKWKSGDWWCCLPLSETSLITCCVLRLVAVSILRLGLAAFFHCCEMKCSSNIPRLTVFSTIVNVAFHLDCENRKWQILQMKHSCIQSTLNIKQSCFMVLLLIIQYLLHQKQQNYSLRVHSLSYF